MNPLNINAIDLHDYLSGGYYLARLREAGVERPVSPRLPRRYISASTGLCDFFTDSWVWDNAGPMDGAGNFVKGIRGFEERLTRAARFGITAERLPDVIRWGQLRCGRDFGFPRGFYRLVDARRAADWISLPPEAFVTFGIGLHRSLSEKFLQAMTKHEDCTTALCVRDGLELNGEGVPLGHELLNVECGHPCHSWICGGAEDDFVERKQLTLNQHGYIDNFETALECTQVIESGEIPGEPGPWFPWLIVHYT